MSYLFSPYAHILTYHIYTSCRMKQCWILFSSLNLGLIFHGNTEIVVELNDQCTLWPVDLITLADGKKLSKTHHSSSPLQMPLQSVHQTTKWSHLWSQALDLVMKTTCLLSYALMYTHDMAEMQSPPVSWPNTWLLHDRDQQHFMWKAYFHLWDRAFSF